MPRLGRDLPLYAGRVVGGSSATNNVMALRGHPAGYDAWPAEGGAGWSFTEILPAFRRLEHDLDFGARPWHGQDGPVPIGRHPTGALSRAQRAFLEASEETGHAQVEDHNAPGSVGAGRLPLNQVDGVRQSAALTYLNGARERSSLTVRADTHVDRVLISRGTVTGVRLVDGTRLSAGTVVVCAGAYGSPGILLRSGIGPARDLRALGIDVHRDAPGVGRNLHDHPLLRIRFAADGETSRPPRQTLLTARGDPGQPQPDLQVFPSGPETAGGQGALTILVALMTPLSRGHLELASADPATPPRINPGHLTEPGDLIRLRIGVELIRQLAAAAPLAHLTGSASPPSRPLLSGESDQLTAAILDQVGAYHHPVGTCRMGPADDPRAVVDPAGRVPGIAGLSVVDASILPVIPNANTNVPVLMAAEHLSGSL